MNFGKTDYSKPKGVCLTGEDMKELDSLVFSPLLLNRMPNDVKGKRNRMILWAVKELVRVLRYGVKEKQLYFDFRD